MRLIICLTMMLAIAAPATAQEMDLRFGCLDALEAVQVFQLAGEKKAAKMEALNATGKCSLAAFEPEEWDDGVVIGTVRAVPAHPFLGTSIDDAKVHLSLGPWPVARIVYFDDAT